MVKLPQRSWSMTALSGVQSKLQVAWENSGSHLVMIARKSSSWYETEFIDA
jgi:hypothetical protein